jgi:hypothetical protein
MRSLPAFAAAAILATAGCTQVAEVTRPAAPPVDVPQKPVDDGIRPPAWLSSEASVFEHVQKTYEELGFPEVRTAVFKVSEDVPLPYYGQADRTLYIPPFLDGADKMRARVAKMSASHFSGALTFVDVFESSAAAYDAYKVFLTIAVAHELSHHIQFSRKSAAQLAPGDVYDIEAEAIEFEQAFLAHLIGIKQVSSQWRDRYRLAVLAIRESIPQRAFDTLPQDEKALRETFAQAYLTYGRGELGAGSGVNVEISAAVTVYAGYTQKRMALFQKGGRSLKELAAAEASHRTAAP